MTCDFVPRTEPVADLIINAASFLVAPLFIFLIKKFSIFIFLYRIKRGREMVPALEGLLEGLVGSSRALSDLRGDPGIGSKSREGKGRLASS
jgi:hypothetical protein